jgi:hypothetical protein
MLLVQLLFLVLVHFLEMFVFLLFLDVLTQVDAGMTHLQLMMTDLVVTLRIL